MGQFVAMLWKELIQVANRRRSAVGRSLLVFLLAVLFFILAYETVYSSLSESVYGRMSEFGRSFFLYSMAFLTVALSLFAMIAACGIVASETVRRRMPLLLVSPLGSGAIVGSKALCVFSQVAVSFLAALPVLSLLQLFGGVDQQMVLIAAVFLASSVWLYGCIGLAASVLSARIIWSLSLAVVALLFWNLLPFIVWAVLYSFAGMQAPAWYLLYLDAFYSYGTFAAAQAGARDLVYHFCMNFAVGTVFLVVAFAFFRPLAMKRLAGPGSVSGKRRLFPLPWRRRRTTRSILAELARHLEPGVISKELASSRPSRVFLPFLWFALPWGVVLLVSLTTGDWPDPSDKDVNRALFFTESTGFFFLLSVFASTRVAAEKEAATLQTLAVTRFSALRILVGKGGAVLVEQAVPLALLFLHLLFVLHLTGRELWGLNVFAFVLSAVLSTSLGLYFSLVSRRIVEAVLATAAAWFLGVYIIILPIIGLSNLFELRSEGVVFIWLGVIAFAVLVLPIFYLQARRRGFGSGVALLSYAIVAAAIYGLVLTPSAEFEKGELLSILSILPVAAIFPAEWMTSGVAETAMCVLAIQVGVLVWMFVASLANFEQQARRAA